MKHSANILNEIFIFCFISLFYFYPASAYSKAVFSRIEFQKLQPILCQGESLETCQYENFVVDPVYLNRDQIPEWIFSAGSGRSGESGVTSFTLVAGSAQKGWKVIGQGSSNYSFHPVKAFHHGYRDIEVIDISYARQIAVQSRYRWSGESYQEQEEDYYFVRFSGAGPILKRVSQRRYEACLKLGEGCPQ